MSDEKTREVPLTDVMGIAEVSDEPTETLPAVDDPGEAKTESFQKPFDGGPEARGVRIAGRGRIAGNLRTRHVRKLCGPFGTSDRFRQIG